MTVYSKKSSIGIVLLLTSALMVPELTYSGAWTQPRGKYYAKLSVLRFSATARFNIDGMRERLADNGEVNEFGFYTYLEYGLFDDLTLVTSLPYKRTSFSCAIEDCGGASTGLADFYLALRYRLSQSDWVMSLQSGFKLPTGYETGEEKLDSAPPLGDGQVDFEVGLLMGRSVLNYRGYLNLAVGYRARAGEPVDEIGFSAEVGYHLTKKYLLTGMIYGVRGISEDSGQTDFRIIDGQLVNFVGTGAVEEFTSTRVQLFYKLSGTFELSFEFEQVWTGRNTAQATKFGAGIVIHN